MELGPTLRLRRRDLALSQRALAGRAQVSQATVARLENGRTDVRLDLVGRVLHALGLEVAASWPGGRRFVVDAAEAARLDRTETLDGRRRPAHLLQETVRGLPYWTYLRHDRMFRGLDAPNPLDVSPHRIYRRTPATAPGTVCHPEAMEVDLAPWWPLLSPLDDHEPDAAYVATLLHSAAVGVNDVLVLASGRGHTASHLSRHFTLTLLDPSPHLVDVSRGLNPHCRHVVADLRTTRLDETFDAVVVDDEIGSVLAEADLRDAVATAYAHCRPGGMAVLLPPHVRETFAAGPTAPTRGADEDGGRGARLHSWAWDPDPADTWVLTTRAFVLRHADGRVDTGHETHRTGLFARDVWLDALAQAGFEPSAVEDDAQDDERTAFVGYRPLR